MKGELASSGEVTLVGMVSEMCEEDGKGVDVSMTESRAALKTDNDEGVSITSRSNDIEFVVGLALAGTSLRIGGGCLTYVAA